MTDSSLPPDDAVHGDESRGLIPRIIGTLFLLLPAATSIQAWLVDAPGKVWLSTFAVVALAAGVIGWWFFRGLLFLLGLLAAGALIVATVYLYGVDATPLAIAGVPLRFFVPGLFLVALALAAWELARLPKLPLWARLIAPALAVFAAVPVVMGLIEGVPFVEVLVGLWTLPYWTQGAWFGAAIMLPAALLVAVLKSAVPAWRDAPFRAAVAIAAITALLTTSLATSFTMNSRGLINLAAFMPVLSHRTAVAQETGYGKSASAQPAETSLAATVETAPQPETSATADPAATRPDATIDATDRDAVPSTTQGEAEALWQQLETAVADIPRDSFDPAAIVARVGTNPEALFAWVRDETVLVPYCGALKGPEGVLLDRGGNSLDRALLLHELLTRAGHRSRLAHAELTPAQTVVLMEALGRDTPAILGAASDPAQLADRAAAELGLDTSAVRTRLDAAARAGTKLHKTLAARTERQSSAILSALRSGAEPAVDDAGFLADHWWVLLERRGAEPLDLDPSLPTAEAGDQFADAKLKLKPGSMAKLASVGAPCDKRLHRIRVRAVAEVFDGKKLREHVLLDRELLPIDLFGRGLTLTIASFGGPEAPDPFNQIAPADALIAALLQHNEWQPRLTIGTETVAGKAITDEGEIRKQPGRGGSGGGTFGGLGGSLGGGDGGKSEGFFTAFWWTFEVSTPGVGTSTERRQVFDLIGPAARAAGVTDKMELDEEARTTRALTLAGQTELVALTAAPSTDLLNFVAASRLLAERDAWQALYEQGRTLPIADLADRLNALGALRTPLERYALHRGRFASAAGWGPQAGLLVLAHHRRLRKDLSTDQAFDLIATPPGGAQQDGFRARLTAGVADTNLEALLATGKEPRQGDPTIADAFDRAPHSWRIVRQPDDLDGSTLPADLAARVANDLAVGFIALVPTDTRDAVGWWRIDPSSGATFGFGSRGWGQATASYVERLQVLLQVRGIINSYASMGRCLVLAVTQPLRGIETGVSDELAECIFTTVCGAINDALSNIVEGPPDWTNIILLTTIAELWGGTPETGFGGLCGGLWSQLK